MRYLRAHLRTCAVVWLLCQFASLSAFARPACCAAHGGVAAEAECHKSADAVVCPMHATEGAECPMHAGGETTSHVTTSDVTASEGTTGADDCVMRGNCNGPAVALGALLTLPGVMPDVAAVAFHPFTSRLVAIDAVLPDSSVRHDTPPPRL